MKNRPSIRPFLFLLIMLSLGACSEEFLEPEVTTAKDINTSVNTAEDLRSIVYGAYDRMNARNYYGKDYIIFAEVRSDNAYSNANSSQYVGPGQFFLTPTDYYPGNTWQQIYSVIANANIVINTEVADNESAEVQYIKGQAYAIRALAYMDLLGLYGQQYAGGTLGVPLVLEFSEGEPFPERASVEAVWAQIGQDFQTAIEIMDPSLDKGTPTVLSSGAVYGLQSRYYLYVKDYAKAAAAAKKVIDSGRYSVVDTASYPSSWATDGGNNVLFELAFTQTDNLSFNSLYFMYQHTYYGDIVVTNDLYNLYGDSDVRRDLYQVNGDTIRMLGKYPSESTTDNIKIIRYAEVVLNYAEALVQLGSPEEALPYLNMIPANRGSDLYSEATLDNVLLERRKELAMEGLRFFDLMRYERAIPYVDARQTFDEAGIPYGSSALAFPIPQVEISANANVEQNQGY